ncbi:PGG domain-containing protein [Heracleum sosnowskyi]|uniref:PGG domain-containing protein n=1 Tax=Heracleum sosnowskyi TaxID=360622 RepID=A0AAD8GNR3_9APIA|nr:PGG domain-containing protein [Heracleum sosnowskyi]
MNFEIMEKKLYDACLKGDAKMLEALMREDEVILARISLSSCMNQTPLHLACMLGHFEFAKSLLSYKPDFVSRLDSQGRSPLHLASANGYGDIVGLLLRHDQKMCRVRDEDGRTPLHLAVMNGQHESDMLNIKDDTGNTILHSATTLRRVQIIKHLVMSRSEVLNVNAVDANGLAALDIVERMPKDVKTMEIKELLVSADCLRAEEIKPATTDSNIKHVKNPLKWFTNFTIFQKSGEKRDNDLLVAATVIAAMAYQAAISPPGGVAAMDATIYDPKSSPKDESYHLYPAASLLAYFNPNLSYTFWISNHISFMASLSVIFIYVSGAALKRRIFTWLIRGAMWIILSAMTIAYVCAVSSTTGSMEKYDALYPLLFGLLAWGILIFVSFVVLIYRLLRYILPIIKKETDTKKKNTSHEDSTASKSANANIV